MSLHALAVSPRVSVRNRANLRSEGRCVLYWMQRAQRGRGNAALEIAIRAGNTLRKPIVVLTTLALGRGANLRHYRFFVEGLPEVKDDLRARGVELVLRGPDQGVDAFADEVQACLVISDENPLREAERDRRRLAEQLPIPFWTVDSDVVVPTALIGREHWAARTIRPHIHAHLSRFLAKEPSTHAHVLWPTDARTRKLRSLDPSRSLLDGLATARGIAPVSTFRGGPRQARLHALQFIRERLTGYARRRNRPEIDGTSRLSPYLHFGHIGPVEIALSVAESGAPEEDRAAFLDELIVRRELAVNFVRYNAAYDRLDGCERWARATLARHARDARGRVPVRLLADAESPDPLWNAAQAQMLEIGWMHGYMRMYWAKRLLEWTSSAEEAFALAITLNDTYELDGCDPNGYAGVAWAIGGKHDRAFAERSVFGKIRYMSPAAAARRFDARAYMARYLPRSIDGTPIVRHHPEAP